MKLFLERSPYKSLKLVGEECETVNIHLGPNIHQRCCEIATMMVAVMNKKTPGAIATAVWTFLCNYVAGGYHPCPNNAHL